MTMAKKEKKKSNIQISKIVDETEEILCWYCKIINGDPNDPLLNDDWDMCKSCEHWCHLTCGQYAERKFTCTVCFSCAA